MAIAPKPSGFRLPIAKIMGVLVVMGLGISGVVVVAIAPQLLPQFQMLWSVGHDALDLTLGNIAGLDNRVSLITWYLSSVLLLAAMVPFGMVLLISHRAQPISGLDAHAITLNRQRVSWMVFGASLLFFSADKSTGLHHALVHDVLYRFPFAIGLKKKLMLIAGLGLLSGFLWLIRPLWKSLCPSAKRLLVLAGSCFVFSEMGMDGVGYFLRLANGSVYLLSLSLLEALIDQLGGLLLVVGLLWQFNREISRWA